jgi:hypothetical protein
MISIVIIVVKYCALTSLLSSWLARLLYFARKMQISGATTDLASKGQCISDSSNVKVKGEIDDPFHSDIKVRCLCGSSLETESMIKVCLNIYVLFPQFFEPQ